MWSERRQGEFRAREGRLWSQRLWSLELGKAERVVELRKVERGAREGRM